MPLLSSFENTENLGASRPFTPPIAALGRTILPSLSGVADNILALPDKIENLAGSGPFTSVVKIEEFHALGGWGGGFWFPRQSSRLPLHVDSPQGRN